MSIVRLPLVPWETVDVLRVVNVETGVVIHTIFEAGGTLGHSASAHMQENGAFVLELTMITGFDRTQTRLVLWTAPNTESGHGGYARQAEGEGGRGVECCLIAR